jgi:hypothetical protein
MATDLVRQDHDASRRPAIVDVDPPSTLVTAIDYCVIVLVAESG